MVALLKRVIHSNCCLPVSFLCCTVHLCFFFSPHLLQFSVLRALCLYPLLTSGLLSLSLVFILLSSLLHRGWDVCQWFAFSSTFYHQVVGFKWGIAPAFIDYRNLCCNLNTDWSILVWTCIYFGMNCPFLFLFLSHSFTLFLYIAVY